MREFSDLVNTALMDVQTGSRRHAEQTKVLTFVRFRFDRYRDMDPAVADLIDRNCDQRGTCDDHIAYALPEAVVDQFVAQMSGVEIERISGELFYQDYART